MSTESRCNADGDSSANSDANAGSRLFALDQFIVSDGEKERPNGELHGVSEQDERIQFTGHDVDQRAAERCNGKLFAEPDQRHFVDADANCRARGQRGNLPVHRQWNERHIDARRERNPRLEVRRELGV